MKKVIGSWGILTILGLCKAVSIPTSHTEPIEVMKQPLSIVETVTVTAPQRHITHYEDVVTKYQPREYSCEEAQMLMRIAEAEAGNQGKEGMKLVMAVVLNRVESTDFPNSIEDVIFQANQFQPISDGRYYTVELSEEVHLALSEIEQGLPIDTDVIGFEITANNKSLNTYFDYAYTVGGHDFYVQKGE